MGDFRIASLEREYKLAMAADDLPAAQRAIDRAHDLREASVRREQAENRGEVCLTGKTLGDLIQQAERVLSRAKADGNERLARQACDAALHLDKIPSRFSDGRPWRQKTMM